LFCFAEAQLGATFKETNIKQVSPKQVVDYNKLFFSVFSVLQKLGSDDRPEVHLLSKPSVLCMNTRDIVEQFFSSSLNDW
jgi:hypothetical protein